MKQKRIGDIPLNKRSMTLAGAAMALAGGVVAVAVFSGGGVAPHESGAVPAQRVAVTDPAGGLPLGEPDPRSRTVTVKILDAADFGIETCIVYSRSNPQPCGQAQPGSPPVELVGQVPVFQATTVGVRVIGGDGRQVDLRAANFFSETRCLRVAPPADRLSITEVSCSDFTTPV